MARRRRHVRRYTTRRSSSVGNGCGYVIGSVLLLPFTILGRIFRFK